MITKKIEIEVFADKTDISAQCIYALQQVMSYYEGKLHNYALERKPLSKNEKMAVSAWFTQRYGVDTTVEKLERG